MKNVIRYLGFYMMKAASKLHLNGKQITLFKSTQFKSTIHQYKTVVINISQWLQSIPVQEAATSCNTLCLPSPSILQSLPFWGVGWHRLANLHRAEITKCPMSFKEGKKREVWWSWPWPMLIVKMKMDSEYRWKKTLPWDLLFPQDNKQSYLL